MDYICEWWMDGRMKCVDAAWWMDCLSRRAKRNASVRRQPLIYIYVCTRAFTGPPPEPPAGAVGMSQLDSPVTGCVG